MINRVRTIFTKALYYLRLWAKETDLSARQIVMIEDLRKEIKDLDNYDLCPAPTTEFQKIEQLREMERFLDDFRDLSNKEYDPQNEELAIMSNEIGLIHVQIMTTYISRYDTLSESGLQEFCKSQSTQTKTIDKDNELQKELVEVLFGRKELAEELISINSKIRLHHWCKEHSGELYQKVNANQLFRIVKDLKIIENLSITYETFNNWLKGK